MKNLVEKYEKDQIKKLTSSKNIPAFRSGDTLKITIKIVEGERSRLQAFEGVCIARKNNGLNSSFTVRKISHGEGVERVFPLFNPLVDKIEVVRKGDVNRAKLYYLRQRKGKSARIIDSDRGEEIDQYSSSANEENISAEEKNKIDEKNENNQNNQSEENKLEDQSTSLDSKTSTNEEKNNDATNEEKIAENVKETSSKEIISDDESKPEA